ncbi:MAG: hypothetical protein RMJ59_04765 [Candidatus Nitrosocaldus sp.]|nr:hypothetical protein [Candidatus Nitrosocaldus sp.]MCS7141422.1 hypothetical protein [Candidatus Nitrosocaldus sp.]MDW8000784.1 hypothetical protein [Candidatus Nitrosocaldus sp.]MDW8275675.1 hypothetical protein [Candidatus Nitrosocaldus sp.]
MLQAFRVRTTDEYSRVRRAIENIIMDLESKLHRRSYLEFSDLMESMGWRFFTISIDIYFIEDMGSVMPGLLRAKGHTYLDKFANYLQARLREEGLNVMVGVEYGDEYED